MTQLTDLISGADSQEVIQEVKYIYTLISTDRDDGVFDEFYNDVVHLFNGTYPGYRASNTKYHDLEHTNLVVLAVVRLMHGCFLGGHACSPQSFILGFAAALFHDVGLIQSESEVGGSGAKFTVGHEERSIDFMRRYLIEKKFPAQTIEDCADLIRCTCLSLKPSDIHFRNKEIEKLGKIVGSADLLGQMADRYYLEKLLLLFKEFEEAKISVFDSELDLLQKTESFYESVAQRRLNYEFGGTSDYMRLHFKHRWKLDRDLYSESITNHINYLKGLIATCKNDYHCYLRNLKRGGIVQKNFSDFYK